MLAYSINDSCDGCSACFGQCPTFAIHGKLDARFDIDPRACIDCGVCGWICPIDAVLDQHGQLAERRPRDQRPHPVFVADRCNGCRICASYCPFGCIEVIGPRYSGAAYLAIPDTCVSCDECRYACMKGAISLAPIDLRTYDPTAERSKLARYLADESPATSAGEEP